MNDSALREKRTEMTCEGCDGDGVRDYASTSCEAEGALTVPAGWRVVERCDSCERYDDDLTAALSLEREARWVECRNGGNHALAKISRGQHDTTSRHQDQS